MSDSDWTILLSGPLAQRGPLLAALDRAGADVSWQPPSHPSYGLETDDLTGWITVRHADVDAAVEHTQRAGWALRMHWPTPRCKVCTGLGKVNGPDGLGSCLHCAGIGASHKPPPQPVDPVAELLRRVAELEAKGV
jgi:hypothetical protein